MRIQTVFLLFLLAVPLHAQGVFVKEMPDGFHLSVKHALKQRKIRVVDSVENATLVVDGYGRLASEIRNRDNNPGTSLGILIFGKFECDSMLEFTKPNGEQVYRKKTGGSLFATTQKSVEGCAKWLVGKFYKRMKKKNKPLLASITKED